MKGEETLWLSEGYLQALLFLATKNFNVKSFSSTSYYKCFFYERTGNTPAQPGLFVGIAVSNNDKVWMRKVLVQHLTKTVTLMKGEETLQLSKGCL